MNAKLHLTTEEIWEYIDSPSLPGDRQKHLEECIACQGLLHEIKTIDIELKSLTHQQPSMAFSRKVVNRWKSSKVSFPVFTAVATGIFILLAVLSVVLSLQIELTNIKLFLQWFSLFVIVTAFWLWDTYSNNRTKQGTTYD